MLLLACVVLISAVAAVPVAQPNLRYLMPGTRYLTYLQRTGRDVDPSILEDAQLDTLGLVAKYGYEGEEHTVQTEDGYLLTIHRMRSASVRCTGSNKIPVLLQHGLLSSSADWVIMGPGKGLGYILADACFDVWMGNSRGNTFSRGHASLDNKSDEYWDFSWHEMGLYDIPTVIDYILARTGHPTLHYVGHSQGTTQFFIMDSLKPEYRTKIRAMFALAPIAFMGHAHSSILTTISKFINVVGWVADKLGINQLLPSTDLVSEVGGKLCNDEHPNSQHVCENLLFAIAGYDEAETNGTLLPAILGHVPAGSATKQFVHYAQLINTDVFQMFDYGKKENQERYGQNTPPEYPLKLAKSPIALFYSDNDYFAALEDVDILYTRLGNPLGKFHVPIPAFNHLDYLWAIHAKEAVYDRVLDIMNRY